MKRVNATPQPQSRSRYPLVTEFGRFDRAAIIVRAQEHRLSMEWAAALSKAYREASDELRARFNRTTTVPKAKVSHA